MKEKCPVHAQYKALRKPRKNCIFCNRMWHLAEQERKRLKDVLAENLAAYHGDIDGDFGYW